ncbi:MAG: hypothetical protein WA118_05145 [Carboxydocellales bacterium]
MAVSLGLGLAFILKDEVLTGILNLLIPIVVFLGGGYMPIDGLGKTILWLSKIRCKGNREQAYSRQG